MTLREAKVKFCDLNRSNSNFNGAGIGKNCIVAMWRKQDNFLNSFEGYEVKNTIVGDIRAL